MTVLRLVGVGSKEPEEDCSFCLELIEASAESVLSDLVVGPHPAIARRERETAGTSVQ